MADDQICFIVISLQVGLKMPYFDGYSFSLQSQRQAFTGPIRGFLELKIRVAALNN